MTVTNQDFKVYRGNSYTLHVALTNADGTPYDPSISVDMEWRMSRTWYLDAEITKTRAGGGIAVSTGGVDIDLSSEDVLLDPAIYYHELKIFDAGDVATAMVGAAIVKKSFLSVTAKSPGAAVIPLRGDLALSRTPPIRTP